MSESWIQTCEMLLEHIRKFSAEKDMDRLELVQSSVFKLENETFKQ